MGRTSRWALLAGAAWLASCGGGEDGSAPTEAPSARATASTSPDQGMSVKVSVLSSAPEWVSGGDARIHVRAAPGQRDKLEILINGKKVDAALKEVADGLEGVVSGFALGKNLLQVKHGNGNVRDSLTVMNWPITGPMFTGPQQMPFVCTTIQGAVGRQPMVDSTTAPGYKVTDTGGNVIGYSRDCSIDTFVCLPLPQQRQRRVQGAARRRQPTDRHGDDHARRRPHGRLRRAPRDRLDQPLPLQHRDAGADAGAGHRYPGRHRAGGTASCCTGSRAAWRSATARARCTAAR